MKTLGDLSIVKQAAAGKPAPLEPRTELAVNGKAKRDVAFVGAAALPALPEPPRDLVLAIEGALNPHPDLPNQRLVVTPAVHEAACVRLKLMELRLREATLEDWAAFLLPLCNGRLLASAPDVDDLPHYAEDFHNAMGPIPACVLNVETQRALLAREFFPRVAALREVLIPAIGKARREMPGLRAVVKGEVREPAAPQGPYQPLPGPGRKSLNPIRGTNTGSEVRAPSGPLPPMRMLSLKEAKALTDADLMALQAKARALSLADNPDLDDMASGRA